MSCQTHPQRRAGLPWRGIASGAALTGLLILAAGCGVAGSHVVIDARAAAAHEAIQAAAGEGVLGYASPMKRPHKPARKPGGSVVGSRGALFGGNDGLTQEEHALGRGLAIIRVYYHIGETFPVVSDRQHMAEGSTLLVSLDSDGPSYAAIAAGREDSTIRAFLRAVNQAAFHYRLGAIYVSFEHEPDGPQHAGLGSAAEFRRAWDHVHQLAAAAHLNWSDGGRLRWVLILLHSSYASGAASAYWPGSGEADIVAVDGYDSFRCGNAQHDLQSPVALFSPALRFAGAHGGLPVFISEWGSDSRDLDAQARFIRQMAAYVDANGAIAATMYWDDGGDTCNYRINGHPASLAALAAMGQSAALQGSALAG